jgi:hypothetical protein
MLAPYTRQAWQTCWGSRPLIIALSAYKVYPCPQGGKNARGTENPPGMADFDSRTIMDHPAMVHKIAASKYDGVCWKASRLKKE